MVGCDWDPKRFENVEGSQTIILECRTTARLSHSSYFYELGLKLHLHFEGSLVPTCRPF